MKLALVKMLSLVMVLHLLASCGNKADDNSQESLGAIASQDGERKTATFNTSPVVTVVEVPKSGTNAEEELIICDDEGAPPESDEQIAVNVDEETGILIEVIKPEQVEIIQDIANELGSLPEEVVWDGGEENLNKLREKILRRIASREKKLNVLENSHMNSAIEMVMNKTIEELRTLKALLVEVERLLS